jgi:hypothetical protein
VALRGELASLVAAMSSALVPFNMFFAREI